MKTITCKQLGGACDKVFQVENFEQAAKESQQHGMEMFQAGDQEHMRAMEEMKEKMQDPKVMQEWMDGKKAAFDALPEAN